MKTPQRTVERGTIRISWNNGVWFSTHRELNNKDELNMPAFSVLPRSRHFHIKGYQKMVELPAQIQVNAHAQYSAIILTAHSYSLRSRFHLDLCTCPGYQLHRVFIADEEINALHRHHNYACFLAESSRLHPHVLLGSVSPSLHSASTILYGSFAQKTVTKKVLCSI